MVKELPPIPRPESLPLEAEYEKILGSVFDTIGQPVIEDLTPRARRAERALTAATRILPLKVR